MLLGLGFKIGDLALGKLKRHLFFFFKMTMFCLGTISPGVFAQISTKNFLGWKIYLGPQKKTEGGPWAEQIFRNPARFPDFSL